MRRNPSPVSMGFCFLAVFFLFTARVGRPAPAGISFEDVTEKVGISHRSVTAGAAWGDFNGDGRPDLWVVNHYLTPSLYVSQGDGTFLEVADRVLYDRPVADFHGAAWADFDNDGDQDLLNLTGGGAGRGECPNYLFVNQDGLLKDKAGPLGMDYPLGRGRMPVWFDADRDGRLDVLIMNKPRPGEQAPSALFRQGPDGFEIRSEAFGFRHGMRTRLEKILALADNALHLRFRRGPGSIWVNEVFAQLADLSGDGAPELIAYSNPMRVFSTRRVPFKEITNTIGFPGIGQVQDIAIEDFNGDLWFDMYLARSNSTTSEVVRRDAHTLQGTFFPGKTVQGIRFRSKGPLDFAFSEPWKDPSDPLKRPLPAIFLGADAHRVRESRITLSPDDKRVWGPAPAQHTEKRMISIDYDVTEGLWTMRSPIRHLNFTLKSGEPLEAVETLGFTSSDGSEADRLLINQKGHFTNGMRSPAAGSPTASRSVAVADFDNDMDVDIYLVCSGPAGNQPNLLYENDGNGNFSLVPHAGGAEGSMSGRGENVVIADFDGDGFLDLFVTNGAGFEPIAGEGPHQLFRNRGNSNHWIMLDLEGSASNRDGIGAHILLEAGGKKQVRMQNGGMHFMAQHHQRIHFGLGTQAVVDEITVTWPSGTVQRLKDIRADQVLRVREPT